MNTIERYWTGFTNYLGDLQLGSLLERLMLDIGGIPGLLLILLSLAAIVAIVLSLRAGVGKKLRKDWFRRLFNWQGLKQALRRFLEAWRYLFTSREWRYRSPWLLMISGDNDDSRDIGRYLERVQRNNLEYREKELGATNTEWYFLNNGIVINLLESGHAALPGEDIEWQAGVRELKQLRSERPVDGIVLALPADVLRRGNPKELQALSDELFAKLHRIQACFEFVLPVYLLVTRCDLLRGFTSYWSVQEAEAREQIFGWSSPYRTDVDFVPGWMDEAFDYLSGRLKEIQLHSIALDHPSLKDDDYYLFPSALLLLKQRLKTLCEEIFKPTKYQSSLIFRGLYFTGEFDTEARDDDTGRQSPDTADGGSVEEGGIPDEAPAPAPAKGPRSRQPAFIRELFDQKIFRECNLARPSGRGIFSRDTCIRRFQYGLTAFFIFLFGALIYKNGQLDRQLVAITEVVKLSDSLPTEGLSDCSMLIPAQMNYEFLANLARVDDDLSTIFIPNSYSNDVPGLVASTLSNEAFEKIIFPNLACYLKREARKLNSPGTLVALDTHDRLLEYLDAVVNFELNRERLEAIAPPESAVAGSSRVSSCGPGRIQVNRDNEHPRCESYMNAFIALNEYVYKEPAPAILRRNPDGQHLKALRETSFNPRWDLDTIDILSPGFNIPTECNVDVAPDVGTVSLTGRPISYTVVLRRACSLAVAHLDTMKNRSLLENYQVGGRAIGQDFIATIDRAPGDALGAINGWLDYLGGEWLQPGPGATPCGEIYSMLQRHAAQLINDFGYPEALLRSISADFNETNCTVELFRDIRSQNIPPLGQVVVQAGPDVDGPYRFASAYQGMIPALDSLRQASWLPLGERQSFSCRAVTDYWDPAYLAQVIALYQDYETYTRNSELPLTRDKNSIASSIAHRKLNLAVNDLLSRAQFAGSSQFYNSENYVYRPVSDLESGISDKSRKFDLVKNDLLQILGILRKLGMNDTFTSLTQCSRRYALGVLDSISTLVLDSQIYRKIPSAFSDAASFGSYQFLIDSEGDLKQYLEDQHKRIALIAQYADPLVTFLLNTESIRGEGANAEIMNFNYWNNTLREFNKFSQGMDQNNQVQKLEDYLVYMLNDIDVANCSESDLRLPGNNDIGNDLFSSKRLDIQMRVVSSCNQALSAGFENRYAELASWFNTNLAGKYPFQQRGNPLTSELAPRLVREFFGRFGDGIDSMSRLTFLLGKSSEQWKQVDTFLMQLAELRDFFGPGLNADGGGKPLMLQLDFARFQNYNGESNAWPEIAGGVIDTGNASRALFDGGDPLPWSFGERLGAELNWALNSEFVPLRTADSTFTLDPANPRRVVFNAGGNWALLNFLDRYRSRDNTLNTLGETGTVVLEFPVTLRHLGDESQNPAVSEKSLYVAVTILAEDPQSQSYQPLALPSGFPAQAPEPRPALRLSASP